MNIMLLFKCGPISFELMGIFRFSFQLHELTSPKKKCDQETKNKKVLTCEKGPSYNG